MALCTELVNHFVSFDYDDTLLCSTYLTSLGLTLSSTRQQVLDKVGKELETLSASVCGLLEAALERTPTVHIVTNAERGWVEQSAQLFIPLALPVLNRCTIISARSTFETNYGDRPLAWKYHTFRSCLAHMLPTHRARNVMSFGDSNVEREAIRAATRDHPTTQCKSVKFSELPSCEELVRQQELVRNCFQYIFSHANHLDLALAVTASPNVVQQPTKNRHTSPVSTPIPCASTCASSSSSSSPTLPPFLPYIAHTKVAKALKSPKSAPLSIPRSPLLPRRGSAHQSKRTTP
jgi:hypothetical protein